MIGLLIRLLVLCSVVFAVVYAVTRALRGNVNDREARRITEEIRALRQLIQLEQIEPSEYEVIADRIRRDCARIGIAVPELPGELPARKRKD